MPDENSAYPKSATAQPRALEPHGIDGARRFSPSVARNHAVIAEVFLDNVPDDANVLEIGSGTGEHGIHITAQAPALRWNFTDISEEALPGIAAWISYAGRAGLSGPYHVNAAEADWGQAIEAQGFDAIFSANVIHISPFTVTQGLFAGAQRLLADNGKLIFYGPFARDGKMVDSNKSFDADLNRRSPDWGVRDVESDLEPLAVKHGFCLALGARMPANNLMLIFQRG